ncbi:MAG: ABC transporter permease [Gammaproteobacteria bacterium]|nr:ABC transporter permease [Gammaproteobacteria bacterium]
MEIRPILSALLRNRTGAVLIALQIAVTLAVVINAAHIVKQRLDLIGRPTGMDVANIFEVHSFDFAGEFNYRERVRGDLELLRNMPGVRAATVMNQVPLSGGGSSSGYFREPEREGPEVAGNHFTVDEQAVDTLGVSLSAGRNFRLEEIDYMDLDNVDVDSVLVTAAFAERLFPDGDALGSTIYSGGGDPLTIIGIIEHMHGSWVDWEELDQVVLLPVYVEQDFVRYVVRTEPGRRDEVLGIVEQKLSELDRERAVRGVRSMEELAAESYRGDRMMAVLLTAVIFLLIAITALGIVGLASFSVKSRTKQIGTRRAIGASRFDIVRYFLVENWLITTGGVILGSVLAVAFNLWLVRTFELPKLDFIYIPLGILALWILGQLAVLGPARRAASIAPAIATRTV